MSFSRPSHCPISQAYTGQVVWELPVGLKAARAQLGDIVDHLTADRSVGVASEQLAIENVGGKGQVIVGRVKFGAQTAVVRRGLLDYEDLGWLRDLFERSVRGYTQGVVLASERASLLGPSSGGDQPAPTPEETKAKEEAARRRKATIMRDLESTGMRTTSE